MRFTNHCKKPLPDGKRDFLSNTTVAVKVSPSRFVRELEIHSKQIPDYKEATHVPDEYFLSCFKRSDAKAVEERVVLLEKFQRAI